MFAYCTERLHLSEAEAYLRIAAARASRQHPPLLAMLADGRLHLSGLVKLAPHLTPENRDELLRRATHRSKGQIEELIAETAPRPDAPMAVRKLPEPQVAAAPPQLRPDGVPRPAPALPPTVQPLAPARYKVEFTASAALREKLQRLQALGGGDLAEAIEQAVTERLERLEAKRYAKVATPRKRLADAPTTPSSRYIPAPIRRAVHERDEGRCAYTEGRHRCSETRRLEFHHRHPFGYGGSHDPTNVALLCRAHNAYLARLDYGAVTGP
jgi:hypothetical protein